MFGALTTRLSRIGIYLIGFSLLASLGTVVIVSASNGSQGDAATACIDARNGALYGVQVDNENVRCRAGDAEITWLLGDSAPGGGVGLSFGGSWQSGTGYASGIIVEHNGSSYVSRQTVPAGSEPPNTTFWQVLALRGEQGLQGEPGEDGIDGPPGQDGRDGVDGHDGQDGADGQDGSRGPTGHQGPPGPPGDGFQWRGEFEPASIPYQRNDVVHYDGSTYVVTVEETEALPTDTADWDLFAAGVTDAGSGDPGNSSGNGVGQIVRISETVAGSQLGANNGALEVFCPAEAPRVIGGGFQIVNSDQEPVQPGNSGFERFRGSGPIMDPDGEDSWRVTWLATVGNFLAEYLRVDVTCTTEVIDGD